MTTDTEMTVNEQLQDILENIEGAIGDVREECERYARLMICHGYVETDPKRVLKFGGAAGAVLSSSGSIDAVGDTLVKLIDESAADLFGE